MLTQDFPAALFVSGKRAVEVSCGSLELIAMRRCTHRLFLSILALALAWAIPLFKVSDQNGELYVSWNASDSADDVAYELEYQLLGQNIWRQLKSPGADLQQLAVRVDAGSRITTGGFTIAHVGPRPELKKTAKITFDAKGVDVLEALRIVVGDVNGIEAYRCDEEFDLPESLATVHSQKFCEYADQGAFSWYILAYREIPELQILEARFDGRWSGECDQVAFKQLHPGIIDVSYCKPKCTVPLRKELDPVQYYSFRVMVNKISQGWTKFGANSQFQPLIDTSLPKRLPPPDIVRSVGTAVTLILERKGTDPDSKYTVQYTSTNGPEFWKTATTTRVHFNGTTVVAELFDLEAGMELKFRARRQNRNGAGPFSPPSATVKTTPLPELLPDGAVIESSSCSNATLTLNIDIRGFPIGHLDLQHKKSSTGGWEYLPRYQQFRTSTTAVTLAVSDWDAIYQLRVRAVLENRASEWSNVATVRGCAPYAADPTAAPIVRAKQSIITQSDPSNPNNQGPEIVRPVNLSLVEATTTTAVIAWQLPLGDRCDVQGYEVQLAHGKYSEDFQIVDTVPAMRIKLTNLKPVHTYRVRVRVLCKHVGYGRSSDELMFQTLAVLRNLWQNTEGAAHERSWYRHGIDLPFETRPGETLEEVRGPKVHADPPTPTVPDLPDPRTGASFAAHASNVYMFGGRSTGKECAFSDLVSIDQIQAGLPLSTCSGQIGVVDEFWRLDPILYEWEFLQPENSNPPSRERHSATVVDDRLLVFGGFDGKSPLADLWEIQLPTLQTLTWSGEIATIDPAEPAVSTISISDLDMPEVLGAQTAPYCIADFKLHVDIVHPCAQELTIRLAGPGPNTGSVNFFPSSSDYEVLVVQEHFANNAFCVPDLRNVSFHQNESTTLAVYFEDPHNDRSFLPEESFEGYYGSSPVGDWTLTVIDTVDDGNAGTVLSWNISFTLEACNPTYTWRNLTTGENWPTARYDHIAIRHRNSVFVYSGRDASNHILDDLWRYDVTDARWTQLLPVVMNGWDEIVEWGLQPVMTPRGMVVVTEDCPGSRVACRRLVLQDPFTEQWETIENVTASQKHAAVAFISPKRLRDAQTPWFAEYANMQDFQFDRVLWFGGGSGLIPRNYNAAISILWLQSWKEDAAAQQSYRRQHCGWRFASSWLSKFDASCMASTNKTCSIRDIIQYQVCLEEL